MPGTGLSDRPHVRTTRAVPAASKRVEDPMHRDSNAKASDDESLDLQALKETVTLIVRAPFRRKKVALVTAASVMALGAALGLRWKPTYQAQAAILVQRNVTIPNCADPTHT